MAVECDAISGGERPKKKDWGIQQYLKDNAGNLVDPDVRRNTFKWCLWNQQKKPSIDVMVGAGFYHSGYDDKVFCYHCKKDFSQWKDRDNPIVEHKTHSPRCAFIRGLADVSVNESPVHQISPQGGQMIPATSTSPAGAAASTAGQAGFSYDRSTYGDQKKREDSFGDRMWSSDPHVNNQSKWLVQRGFFAPRVGDFTVECYDCGFTTDGRNTIDDIVQEHTSPQCAYR